jgi:hypothetical protein
LTDFRMGAGAGRPGRAAGGHATDPAQAAGMAPASDPAVAREPGSAEAVVTITK